MLRLRMPLRNANDHELAALGLSHAVPVAVGYSEQACQVDGGSVFGVRGEVMDVGQLDRGWS